MMKYWMTAERISYTLFRFTFIHLQSFDPVDLHQAQRQYLSIYTHTHTRVGTHIHQKGSSYPYR